MDNKNNYSELYFPYDKWESDYEKDPRFFSPCTIKGASRRAEKGRKVLMIMKAAKVGWAGAGAGAGAGNKQGWTKSRARKGRSRAGAG